jgi:DNA-binding XRE family transcriptional regulator
MTESVDVAVHSGHSEAIAADSLAGLPPAPADNPLWEDTPHRPGDPPLERLPRDLWPNTPGGLAVRRLGRQLRAWRERQGMTQRDVAARLGWDQPTVARLEGGGVAPTTTTLALLVDRLGMRIAFGPGQPHQPGATAGPVVTVE